MFFLCVTRCPIYHQHTESKCEVCLKIANDQTIQTVKKSIPYGLGVGVKRICDDKEEYEKERSKIKERLTQRGYNSSLQLLCQNEPKFGGKHLQAMEGSVLSFLRAE
jgi:hypothetical protein